MENPFVITGHIKPAYFCDRKQEAKRIVSKVMNGENLVLMAARRVGKSKLIDFCLDYPEKNMEAILRTYIQKCSNANFIFSGSERHLITEMFSDRARPFYNSADIMSLDVIPLDKYTEFAVGLFHQFGKDVDADAVALAYQTFDGNTYYMQKVMHEAFNQTDQGSKADGVMIEAIIHSLVLDNDRKFSEILSWLTLPQKELMYAIAKDVIAKQITSAAFVRKHKLRSASSVQSAIRKLMEYHLVSTSQGTYYIDDQLMGVWLRM